MNVLMISSEAVPFCKSGGLADVAGALPAALCRLGVDARVLIPLYGMIDRTGMSDTGLEGTVFVDGADQKIRFLTREYEGVRFYFLDHPSFSQRPGIYGNTSFTPYLDNLERYAILDKAAFVLCRQLGWKPDVMHAHDWTVGFVPALLKREKDKFFSGTKSVFTIHNLAYQGDFSRLDLLKTDIEPHPSFFKGEGRTKRTNMLQAGIAWADEVTTVSPTYAREIQGGEYGCGLEGLLSSRRDHLTGIINGIDTEEWDSEKDPYLPYHFSRKNMTGKALMKAEVQEEFGLAKDPDVPLIAMISRIADQKGFKELLEGDVSALERIVRDCKVQMVIIGTGDTRFEDRMKEIASRYRNLSVNILFDNRKAHRLEAGADYFLMPSRFEPCGLNQLYSLRYGTLPIVRRTGGLADSVIDLDDHPDEGTGFLFDTLTGEEIENAVKRALGHWPRLEDARERAMGRDSSWKASAQGYLQVYNKQ